MYRGAACLAYKQLFDPIAVRSDRRDSKGLLETCKRRDWRIRDPTWRKRDPTWEKSDEIGEKANFVGEKKIIRQFLVVVL